MDIWEKICYGVTGRCSFQADWDDWIGYNLRCNKLVMGKVPNCLIFAVSLWYIWKWRCERIFNPTAKATYSPSRVIWNYVEEWLTANNKMDEGGGMIEKMVSWNPPPLNGSRLMWMVVWT